ncbi:unnamed protein product [Prorocentrum cordatum]|uniref:Uncharacterized protein n=1 Tax=Prorocentrum cordatum TaxID=2364126 RepID=A0ABN9T7D3_9DINO|nr:unnamed protein product [Polarella glacialis]
MIASEQPVTGTPTAPREQEGRGSRKEQRGRRSEGCPSRSAQGGGVSGPLVDAPCAYVFGRASAGCAASPSVLETLCRREREREGGRGKGGRGGGRGGGSCTCGGSASGAPRDPSTTTTMIL